MRAAFFEEHGGPEVLKICERPDPEPGPDDALVEVSACGLNHLDIWVRLGGKRNFPLPIIPGSDPAGVVLEAP
ncbi:MAG TPA: alcohol dehydrogenase, partial [Planctomycetes bacterium]|nr:alcohol dehydrogenase [Planctomycetota bacterium]